MAGHERDSFRGAGNLSDFEQVHERESQYSEKAAPGEIAEALKAAPPPAHDEPEARRRARVERMIHRGRGVSYPRPFRVRF